MRIGSEGDPFVVFSLKWPEAIGGDDLPEVVIVRIQDYVIDTDDDDEIDREFTDKVERQTGVRPLGFGFAPFEDADQFECAEDALAAARELAADYGAELRS